MTKKIVKKKRRIQHLDGWQNTYTGLGTALDKLSGHLPNAESWYDEETLEAIYHTDAIAQRIITEIVDCAFRNGWCPAYSGDFSDGEKVEEDKKAIIELLDGDEHGEGLNATDTVKKGIYWGRLYGRSAVLIGADDRRDMAEPLEFERIQNLYFLEDLDSRDFYPLTYYSDPLDKNFGYPETWMVQRQSGSGATEQTEVHGTRLIIFGSNIPTSKRKKSEEQWRAQPVLQALYERLRNYSSSEMSIANMMTDASIAVLKIAGLRRMMAGEDIDAFANRMRILTMGRGLRIMPIDEDETYEYVERSFTGIPDTIDRQQAALAGTAGYPSVLLFGKGSPGLANEELTADRYWTGKVKAAQTEWAEAVTRLVRIAAKIVGAADPQGWYADFEDVWSKTPEEIAIHRKSVADTDHIYVADQVLTPEEIAVKRFGSGEFDDGAPQIDIESRQAMIESDMERMKEGPPEMDPMMMMQQQQQQEEEENHFEEGEEEDEEEV